MDKALKELKIRAKKLLKACQQDPQVLNAFEKILRKHKWSTKQELKLKDCQNLLAIKCGFKNWQEAQQNLTGQDLSEVNDGDFSGFWHSPSCDVLLNQWFASYQEAKQALNANRDKVLLPYKRQFVVAGTEYLNIIGLSNKSLPLLSSTQRNLFESYGSNEWDELAKQVLISKLDK